MDLFDYMRASTRSRNRPWRPCITRPTHAGRGGGAEAHYRKGQVAFRAIKADQLGSIIFGPPGTGKRRWPGSSPTPPVPASARSTQPWRGRRDMECGEGGKGCPGMYGKTILFVDEIHRFNKGQQDYLLPFVEDGTIILIGATTENPYFEVNELCCPDPSFLS